jgi:hypothetical protein
MYSLLKLLRLSTTASLCSLLQYVTHSNQVRASVSEEQQSRSGLITLAWACTTGLITLPFTVPVVAFVFFGSTALVADVLFASSAPFAAATTSATLVLDRVYDVSKNATTPVNVYWHHVLETEETQIC